MSYAIAFSSSARQALAQLDIDLQETVLDELDQIADAADSLPSRPLSLSMIHDVMRETAEVVHYVFLTIEYDPQHSVVTVTRLGHHARLKGRG